jgi:acetyl esterase/lipase
MIKKKRILILLLNILIAAFTVSAEQRIMYLWHNVKTMQHQESVMFMSRPSKANGTAVIICPGGSYHHLGMYNEGYCTAAWFNSIGVTTFTLRYRVNEGGYHYPAMMEDIQRAIELVRENADKYGIDPHKVGAIGYSAGGHLVTWAGAFASRDNELEKLGIHTTINLRPDFVIPVYPVVSMNDAITNKWSRSSLLGKDQSPERKNQFSMENQIPIDMPPVYLTACHDDKVVPFVNSELLYKALQTKNIPCRFSVYEKGGHGFGMQNNKFMKLTHWNLDLEQWLRENDFIN